MSRIKGIPITLINKVKTGVDGFGHPIFEEKQTIIQNILVAPLTTTEVAEALNMYGKKAVYNLAIPKGDQHTWKDQKVEFFGRTWQVIGFPKRGIEENLPLDWNEIWMVADYE